ncbi:MAG: hypothetical protein JWN48_3993 [Myxococcaceae bacterium]|nr:hypothetical protein [Myxococcaceae bacterium]
MVHSISKVRRSGAALLFAGGLVASACGDDSNGDAPAPGKDSGTAVGTRDGGLDAGNNNVLDARVSDGAVVPVRDASAADIAAALNKTGVDTSVARAQILFPLACQHASDCGMLADLAPGETVDSCGSAGLEDYQAGVDADYSDACLDGLLDLYSCLSTVSCDMVVNDCVNEYKAQRDACAPFIQEDDAGT